MIDSVVFIADRVDSHAKANIYSTNLEKLSDEYFHEVSEALESICNKVTYYSSPKEFIDMIHLHQNDVVLSLWSGENSHNRRALVPSICEAYGIAYVGADSYLQLISQDKHLSKSVIERYELKFPKGVLIQSKYDIILLNNLKFPAVVKPNFEGGSIGIFSDNLVYSFNEAKLVCEKLLPKFNPLVVEEFIPGEEISVCIAGICPEKLICQAIRLHIGDKAYMDNEIFSAEYKKIDDSLRRREAITSSFPKQELERVKRLFFSFKKAEVMRIDGRMNTNGFYVFELTPDCSLSHNSSIWPAFKEEKYNYYQMLAFLLQNAIINHQMGIQNATL